MKFDELGIEKIYKEYGNQDIIDFVKHFFIAISMTDDIVDKDIHFHYALETIEHLFIALYKCPKDLQEKIMPAFLKAVEVEKNNLFFRPFSKTKEQELQDWKSKQVINEIFFETLVYVDSSFDTEENRNWYKEYVNYCFIYDDCENILTEDCTDLVNLNRNYVALQLGSDVYFNWKERRGDLLKQTIEVLKDNVYIEPKDIRLKKYFDSLGGI